MQRITENGHPSILILGCGYLGSSLLRQAKGNGWQVDALSRNPDTCAKLKELGARSAVASGLEEKLWHEKFEPQAYDAIFVTVGSAQSTPDGYQRSYVEGLRSVIEWLSDCPRRLVFTSSISAYGGVNGERVDEQTRPDPVDWRGRIMLEAESILLDPSYPNRLVFRLGGIYGPQRNSFLKAKMNIDDMESLQYFLNLIHVEDASDAMLTSCRVEAPEFSVFNLTDHHPFLRADLEIYLRDKLPLQSVDQPRVLPVARPKRRSSSNRRIDASRFQRTFNWKPKYASVFEAIDVLLQIEK